MKVLLTADFDPTWQKTLAGQVDLTAAGFNLDGLTTSRMKQDQLIPVLKGFDIFLVGYDEVTEKVIAECTDLKLIASIRGGPEENIDVDAAKKHGVPIIRTVGRTQHPVAEQTLVSMLLLARPMIESTNFVRSGQWRASRAKDPEMLKARIAYTEKATELFGKTLGLVGIGNIGEWVAHLAQAFGMKVLGYDPYLPKERADKMGITLVDLETVMSQSDFVSLHARVSPETEGLIGRDQFKLMKPTASFINTARAVMVDYDALVEALQKGWIRSAAVDVYYQEPPRDDDPLFTVPPEKLLLTTHLAGLSQERIPYHSQHLVEDINAYLRGVMPEAIFDPSVFEEPAFPNRGGKIFGAWKGKP